jgi:hypothetical protein
MFKHQQSKMGNQMAPAERVSVVRATEIGQSSVYKTKKMQTVCEAVFRKFACLASAIASTGDSTHFARWAFLRHFLLAANSSLTRTKHQLTPNPTAS